VPSAGVREVDGVEGCAMLLRAEVFAKAGFFAEDYFLYFEDLELCLRARRAGLGTVVVPEAVALHEGAAATGARPAQRLYFACRNHLRLAEEAYPLPRLGTAARAFSVVGLNLAHLLVKAPAPRAEGLRALARGTLDYLRGRSGDPG
jgi:N-acetylglucosaminyl-diphospho-decaprenol L-rhamnosyltransferase